MGGHIQVNGERYRQVDTIMPTGWGDHTYTVIDGPVCGDINYVWKVTLNLPSDTGWTVWHPEFCEVGVTQDSPQQFVGADQPFSLAYLRAPAPVVPNVIAVYEQPVDGSQIIGYLEPLQYYKYVVVQQTSYWMQVHNPYGLTGWTDLRQHGNLITVGNLLQSVPAELTVEQIFEQASVAIITTVANLNPEQQANLQMVLHQKNLQMIVTATEAVAMVVQYFQTGEAGSLTDAVCLPVSILTGDSFSVQAADSICLFIGLGSGNPFFAWAAVAADPDCYIDSWYIPLQTQILDHTSGSYLFAKYFIPDGGGERCEGMNQYDIWD